MLLEDRGQASEDYGSPGPCIRRADMLFCLKQQCRQESNVPLRGSEGPDDCIFLSNSAHCITLSCLSPAHG